MMGGINPRQTERNKQSDSPISSSSYCGPSPTFPGGDTVDGIFKSSVIDADFFFSSPLGPRQTDVGTDADGGRVGGWMVNERHHVFSGN